jgi:hypothetical protein
MFAQQGAEYGLARAALLVRAAYRRGVKCTLGGYYIAGAQGIFRLSLILI